MQRSLYFGDLLLAELLIERFKKKMLHKGLEQHLALILGVLNW
ncbi:MAG: hypothetical protein AB8A35_01950 [Prochlorococcus sp.]